MDTKQANDILLQLIEQSMATGFFKTIAAFDMCRQALQTLTTAAEKKEKSEV
jgi:predicted kinase